MNRQDIADRIDRLLALRADLAEQGAVFSATMTAEIDGQTLESTLALASAMTRAEARHATQAFLDAIG